MISESILSSTWILENDLCKVKVKYVTAWLMEDIKYNDTILLPWTFLSEISEYCMKKASTLFPFYSWESWATENGNDLSSGLIPESGIEPNSSALSNLTGTHYI